MAHCGILHLQNYTSSLGTLLLGEVNAQLCLCYWMEAKHTEQVVQGILKAYHVEIQESQTDTLSIVKEQLDDYFSGKRCSFDIPHLLIGTDFQKKVWRALEGIAYGETVSYLTLAQRIGCPQGVRAVANAVGKNPLQLLLPCHRVVGKGGEMTGYAGGIAAKQALLRMERHFCGIP